MSDFVHMLVAAVLVTLLAAVMFYFTLAIAVLSWSLTPATWLVWRMATAIVFMALFLKALQVALDA